MIASRETDNYSCVSVVFLLKSNPVWENEAAASQSDGVCLFHPSTLPAGSPDQNNEGGRGEEKRMMMVFLCRLQKEFTETCMSLELPTRRTGSSSFICWLQLASTGPDPQTDPSIMDDALMEAHEGSMRKCSSFLR